MAKRTKRYDIRATLMRIGIARLVGASAAGLIGAWLALALAVSGVARTQDPASALKFMPNESLALAGRAEQLLLAAPEDPPKEAQTLALAALRQQSLNPKALHVLGYYIAAKGDEKTANTYIRAAASQSRRDILAQFWMIEDSVKKGNVEDALVHYDIALRTKPNTNVKLFPILLGALDDPNIRAALSPYIRNDRSWAPAFLVHADANSSNLPALVDLVLESGGLGDPEAAHSQNLELLQRLVNEKYFAEARRLYSRMPGATVAQLAQVGFAPSDRNGQFGAIGWQVKSESDSGASFMVGDDKRTILSIFANAGTTATVATKILYVRPGSYDFAARLSKLDGGEGSTVRWQLRCPAFPGNQPVWSLDSANTSPGAILTVPAGCPVQFLDIIASGGSGQDGLETTILDLFLHPRG
ncbi:hypothetical protein [Sphingomonas sp. KR3-1]|uniref:tetratricopeptide repeat protein n=1 Tax=Sphingomonas sp. KR3-1 TaxID=3156611 RepID=UPI0032B3A013